jgi:hypothetical protein
MNKVEDFDISLLQQALVVTKIRECDDDRPREQDLWDIFMDGVPAVKDMTKEAIVEELIYRIGSEEEVIDFLNNI